MSRVGKRTIIIPEGVTCTVQDGVVAVKGPKGELKLPLHVQISIEIKEKELTVKPVKKSLQSSALWGTYRVLIANMITGVTEGYEKKLELIGTGYKCSTTGKKLTMELGYSHSVEMDAPEGIQFGVEKNIISVAGINKQLVGEIAAQVRSKRKVEPYKGKGLRYVGEVVRRKVGKRAAGDGGK